MARVVGKASMVETRRIAGSRGMILSADEATEVVNTHQFFNFILECFAILRGVAMIAVVAAVF